MFIWTSMLKCGWRTAQPYISQFVSIISGCMWQFCNDMSTYFLNANASWLLGENVRCKLVSLSHTTVQRKSPGQPWLWFVAAIFGMTFMVLFDVISYPICPSSSCAEMLCQQSCNLVETNIFDYQSYQDLHFSRSTFLLYEVSVSSILCGLMTSIHIEQYLCVNAVFECCV